MPTPNAERSPTQKSLSWRRLLTLLILVGSFYGCYELIYPTTSFGVRMTIVVDDHGHEKSASSVTQISVVHEPTLGIVRGFYFVTCGEAAYLDLGGGNNVVALLGLPGISPDGIRRLVDKAFFHGLSEYAHLENVPRVIVENLHKPEILEDNNLPTLVHFGNPMERSSIQAVDPKNSEATLGQGVKFLRVTLELTNQPATSGVILKQLPWLAGYRNMMALGASEHDYGVPELGQDQIFYWGFIQSGDY